MELVGEEKELRALFYELKVADEDLAPEFGRTWEEAATNPSRPRRVLKLSFAFAAILFVTTVCSLGLWWKNWRRQETQPGESSSTGVISAPKTLAPEPKKRILVEQLDYVKPKSRRISSRRQTAIIGMRTAELRIAVAVSSWQSPTATLLESPADEVLTALPQLDQSVTELKAFLPNAVR